MNQTDREVRASLVRMLRGIPSWTREEKVADQIAFQRGFTRYADGAGKHAVTDAGRAFLDRASKDTADTLRTLSALGKDARAALAIDTSTEEGRKAYDGAVAIILGTIVDATTDGKETGHAA